MAESIVDSFLMVFWLFTFSAGYTLVFSSTASILPLTCSVLLQAGNTAVVNIATITTVHWFVDSLQQEKKTVWPEAPCITYTVFSFMSMSVGLKKRGRVSTKGSFSTLKLKKMRIVLLLKR